MRLVVIVLRRRRDFQRRRARHHNSGVAWALIRSCIPEHWPACFWASPNWARKLAEDQHHLHDEQPVMAKALTNDSFQSEKCQNDRVWIIITKTSPYNGEQWGEIGNRRSRMILFSLWNEKVRCELSQKHLVKLQTSQNKQGKKFRQMTAWHINKLWGVDYYFLLRYF